MAARSRVSMRSDGSPLLLSRASLAQLGDAIDRVAREFDELARRDASLPLAERSSSVAVFALRPWEFSMFVALRRKAPR